MRLIAVCTIVLLSNMIVQACDACGCSTGGVGFGYVPFQKKHLIGLTYQYNQFTTEHPPLFANEDRTTSIDDFNTAVLWGRYYFTEKFMVSGYVPFKNNSVVENSSKTIVRGIGDIRIQPLYGIVNKGNTMSDKQLNLFVGGSLVVPSGRIDNDTRFTLPNLQPGTGTFSGGISYLFSVRRFNLGFSSEVGTMTYGTNSNDYRFGNEISSTNIFFYRFKNERSTLIPQIGIYQLHRQKDYLYHSLNTKNPFSGVELIAAQIGSSLYLNSVGLRAYYQIPISSNLSDGLTTPNRLFTFQFLYLLNTKKDTK